MRMSVDSTDITDAGYGCWFAHRSDKITVTLDGVPHPYCIMADEEAGLIHAYAVNTDGGLLTGSDGVPIVNWYRGAVRIVIG